MQKKFPKYEKKKIIWQKSWDKLYAQSVGINEKDFIKKISFNLKMVMK